MDYDVESLVQCNRGSEKTFEYALAIAIVIFTVAVASHEVELVFPDEKDRQSVICGMVVQYVFNHSFQYLMLPICLELVGNDDEVVIVLRLT
jgi:hypothetical protein